jgi:hypothetical protein
MAPCDAEASGAVPAYIRAARAGCELRLCDAHFARSAVRLLGGGWELPGSEVVFARLSGDRLVIVVFAPPAADDDAEAA